MTAVFFKGSGTWFDIENGDLLYPLIEESRSYFSLPPVQSISGIFSISEEDANAYMHTQNLEHVRELFPSLQEQTDNAFLKLVQDGIFTNDDIKRCKFKLKKIRKPTVRSRMEGYKPILVIANNKESYSEDPSKEDPLKRLTKQHRSRSELTLLIRAFLSCEKTFIGDPEPMPALQAWIKITQKDFHDKEQLIESITEKNIPEITLKSGEKAGKQKFCKYYNAQFK
mgnify:CR=1 FL=1